MNDPGSSSPPQTPAPPAPAAESARRRGPSFARVVRVLVLWNLAWWTALGLVVHPRVPGGWVTIGGLALLTLVGPLTVFARAMTGRLYPGAGIRLLVFRPFWYVQLALPVIAGAGAVGALAGVPFGAARVWGPAIAAAAALALTALGIAGWAGSRLLVTRRLDAVHPDLPPELDGVRIAQVSDLHVGPHTSRRHLRKIADAIRAAEPDLVVFTGDQVDDYARDLGPFTRAFGGLRAPLGVFAVAGNHDVYAGWAAVRRGLEAAGQRVLVNEAVPLARHGASLWLAGTGDPAGLGFRRGGGAAAAPDIPRTLAAVPDGAFVVVLAHNPVLWPRLAERGVPLTLSGHTHHGQLSVPRLDWSLASVFLEHAMGAHAAEGSLLYINPGTNYWGLPFRLGALPEVTVITLRAGAPARLTPTRPGGPLPSLPTAPGGDRMKARAGSDDRTETAGGAAGGGTADGPGAAGALEAAARLDGRDFIRTIVAEDLRKGTDGGRVVTRFPPEPNGYLHIGHAKAIALSHGIAAEVPGARFHLRFDDTNPETEDMAYVEAIKRDVAWLGADWGDHLYFASDYFPQMYDFAEHLIRTGKAYVDSQSEEEIREGRGTVTEPGRPSPYRDRAPDESLDLFRRMRAGEFPDGAHVLRGRIDMASPNMLLRDPVLYRIRHASHYRTGDAWCIYPLYDYAHPIEDALECVTHSLCTLEFEINRALYDWVVENIPVACRPRQYEFARGNLDYTVMSKRKLLTLVREGHVSGWDDPRMPTIAGLRRRGFTPGSIRAFWDRLGVAKANSRVDMAKLEFAIRDDLNTRAPRVLCVLRPVRVILTNYPDGASETLDASLWPHDVDREGARPVPFSGEIFIDDDDFREDPPAGWKRLAPGRAVRLRHGYVIRCDEVVYDDARAIRELRCSYAPESLDGDPPADWHVAGAIHWVDAAASVSCEVRLYDRLFSVPDPDAAAAESGRPFTDFLNPDSLVVVENARAEPSLADAAPGRRYQFERLGYFVADEEDSRPGRPVFNRTVTLRDTWGRRLDADPGQLEVAGGEAALEVNRAPELSAEEHRRLREAAAPERSQELQSRRRRYIAELALDDEAAELLTRETATADFFEAAVAAGAPASRVASWVINELPRQIGDRTLAGLPFGGHALGALVGMVEDGTLAGPAAREVLAEMVETGEAPGEIVDRRGLTAIADEAALEPVVARVVAANAAKAEEYRAGRTALMGFFMGQVMKETAGKASPELAKRLLQEALAG